MFGSLSRLYFPFLPPSDYLFFCDFHPSKKEANLTVRARVFNHRWTPPDRTLRWPPSCHKAEVYTNRTSVTWRINPPRIMWFRATTAFPDHKRASSKVGVKVKIYYPNCTWWFAANSTWAFNSVLFAWARRKILWRHEHVDYEQAMTIENFCECVLLSCSLVTVTMEGFLIERGRRARLIGFCFYWFVFMCVYLLLIGAQPTV